MEQLQYKAFAAYCNGCVGIRAFQVKLFSKVSCTEMLWNIEGDMFQITTNIDFITECCFFRHYLECFC